MFSAVSAFGIEPEKTLGMERKELKKVFDARNQIVHEFDIDFSGARRNRRQRRANDIVEMSNKLLKLSQDTVEHVFSQLPDE